MRSDDLAYLRDLAHGLADLAEKNDLGLIAHLYRMAEMETNQLAGTAGTAGAARRGASDRFSSSPPAA